MDINPFSTKFIRPDAGEYFFEVPQGDERSVEEYSAYMQEQLVDKLLSDSSMRWSLIGPHGTGKSTLACCLSRKLQARGIRINQVRLSTAQRHIHQCWKQQALALGGVFVVDGYEQLSIFGKLRVMWNARRLKQRLLITAHQPMRGFRILFETKRTLQTEQIVVRHLLRDTMVEPDVLLKSEHWQQSQAKHGQNLRESLFDAYDWYEKTKLSPRR